MAVRTPLVIGSNGVIQQLQTGDSIAGTGGGASVTGEILFDFGVAPGSNGASTIVAQTAVTATSNIVINVLGTDSTPSHNDYEHSIVLLTGVQCSPQTRSAGVGFTAQMYSLSRLTGVFKARYSF